jgi:anti-sigma regulatory factor (Ser/Thr protein kinase)
MLHIISLPSRFDGSTMTRLIDGVVAAGGKQLPSEIVFDFSSLTFIRPSAVCFLSNLSHWLLRQEIKVSFRNVDLGTLPLKYLDDSLFFEQHIGKKIYPLSRPRSTTRPLRKVSNAESHMWLRSNFVPWLSHILKIPQASLYTIQACISELFNNIKDHTEYDIGSIFIQHFPKESRVMIALADFGKGIPASVRSVRPGISDAEAIIKATEEGFTSKSTPRNRGAGLDYLLRVAVLENGGSVTIYSSRATVSFLNQSGSLALRTVSDTGFCPGTMVEINLKTDTIPTIEEERGDLEW